jgi:hypothetical protein
MRGQIINENDPPMFNVLQWVGSEIKMEDFSIYPNISKMWHNLFQQGEKKALQKIMVTVKAVKFKNKKREEFITKKNICQNLNKSWTKIDTQCVKIRDVQKTLKLVVRNLRRNQANNKIKIPTALIRNIDNYSRTINSTFENLSKINNDIQQTWQQYVPAPPPVESPISPTKGAAREYKQQT